MRYQIWNRISRKTRHLIIVIGGGATLFATFAATTGNAKFYRNWLMPAARLLDAETSHKLSIAFAARGIVPRCKQFEADNLKCNVFGIGFTNPVGLAAGFDKNGEAVSGLLKMGFGFVEIGSVTPVAQEGNTKPRVFRLVADEAIINRYGFNSDGHEAVYERLKGKEQQQGLRRYPDDRNLLNEVFWTGGDRDRVVLDPSSNSDEAQIVGVNLGKNKTSSDPVNDYVLGVTRFGGVADYLVVNISSPNTPGLRDMQGRKQLQELIKKVVEVRDALPRRVPLLVKISPDLSDDDKVDIAAVLAAPQSGVDGLIVSNTTVSRPDSLTGKHACETGGLSGRPLRDLSTHVISDMYRLTCGRLPIIGVGGISSGHDAYMKIRAGASLVQVYTALAYEGPPIVTEIKRQLSLILTENGYSDVSSAVGADHKVSSNTSAHTPIR